MHSSVRRPQNKTCRSRLVRVMYECMCVCMYALKCEKAAKPDLHEQIGMSHVCVSAYM
jgi:hypothetical protein